jgi:predicted CXXCH cytochrome family protein
MRASAGLFPIVLLTACAASALAAAAEKKAPAKAPKAAPGKAAAKAESPARAKPPTAIHDEKNTCIGCHGSPEFAELLEGNRKRLAVTAKYVAGDIHWQKGLRCQDCHGGDATADDFGPAHAGNGGLRSLKPADLPEFCGGCHANIDTMRRYNPSPRVDQLREYWTSGHGQRLKATGDPNVATCISCHDQPHGSGPKPAKHGIRAVADLQSPVYRTNVAKTCATCHSDAKRMAGRQYHGQPIGHDQYEAWGKSVHAKALLEKGDLSAATCNNCHGNHGAVPPQVDSVANACGTCHGKVAALFAQARMKHRFEEVGLPGCATCHGNHDIGKPSDEMLGMAPGAVCLRCHENGKYGATLAGAEAARTMRAGLDGLKQAIADAEEKIAEADRLGMEVRGSKFDLRKATDALTSARVSIHSFAVPPVQVSLAQGTAVADEVLQRAEAALKEHASRRVWLASSLVPIVLVIVLLLLYIRSMPVAGRDETPP